MRVFHFPLPVLLHAARAINSFPSAGLTHTAGVRLVMLIPVDGSVPRYLLALYACTPPFSGGVGGQEEIAEVV
jgi:hypothetical protein